MPSAAKYAGGGFITLDSLKGKPPLIEQIAVVKERPVANTAMNSCWC